MQLEDLREFERGYVEGVTDFATWKDGEQRVGIVGAPLKRYLERWLEERWKDRPERAATPNCYVCAHRRPVPGNCHSSCVNHGANVTGKEHGIDMGWFVWPVAFDPVWLVACDGFKQKESK